MKVIKPLAFVLGVELLFTTVLLVVFGLFQTLMPQFLFGCSLSLGSTIIIYPIVFFLFLFTKAKVGKWHLVGFIFTTLQTAFFSMIAAAITNDVNYLISPMQPEYGLHIPFTSAFIAHLMLNNILKPKKNAEPKADDSNQDSDDGHSFHEAS